MVVRGAGITGAGVLLTQVITFASYIVLARLAGPAVFGTFAAAWTLVGFSTIFVESGMSAALIQRRDRLEEAASTAVVVHVRRRSRLERAGTRPLARAWFLL